MGAPLLLSASVLGDESSGGDNGTATTDSSRMSSRSRRSGRSDSNSGGACLPADAAAKFAGVVVEHARAAEQSHAQLAQRVEDRHTQLSQRIEDRIFVAEDRTSAALGE